jgi:hypothetical protein
MRKIFGLFQLDSVFSSEFQLVLVFPSVLVRFGVLAKVQPVSVL